MQIDNPFQMNDWNMKKFLHTILAIQFAMWGAIGLDLIGFQIPILRPFISFIYLSFIPGIIILRILKLHKLGNIETLLFSAGLSIATLMFLGLLMNTIMPKLGISKPIATIPLIITLGVIILILCILCYIMDKDFVDLNPNFISVKHILAPRALFLYHIPFLAIFGTYLMNIYGDNTILLLLLVSIAVIISGTLNNAFKTEYYPLTIFVIAISLLYHTSLISMYLVEWADISFEYWFAKLVLINSIWDSTNSSSLNGMLSLTMLAPIFAIISGLKLTWVFKIIYPSLFSLVPLGLYQVFRKQTDDKIAFLSICFLMSMFVFYTNMLGLARQQIAELFITVMIMLFVDKQMDKTKRSLLLILFLFSLTVSHYALAYIYLIVIISAWFILIIALNQDIQEFIKKHFNTYLIRDKTIENPPYTNNKTIGNNFVLLSIVIILSWYIYTSNSTSFSSIVRIGEQIVNSIVSDFLSTESTQGLSLIVEKSQNGFVGNMYKMIHLITQILIVAGISHTLLKFDLRNFCAEYLAISIPFLGLVIAGVIIPHFASTVNTSRLYAISLLILSPFCVIGGIIVIDVLRKLTKISLNSTNLYRILSAFFMIYFLFNSGFIHEITGHPISLSLNQTAGNRPNFELHDFNAVTWLEQSIDSNKIVYADAKNVYLIQMELGYFAPLKTNDGEMKQVPDNAYIFLGKENINDGIIWAHNNRLDISSFKYENSTFATNLNHMDEVYDSGHVNINYN